MVSAMTWFHDIYCTLVIMHRSDMQYKSVVMCTPNYGLPNNLNCYSQFTSYIQ